MSDDNEASNDTMTPLDLTLERIGMGYYQWSLLGLCGFGWLADNMWMEAVAIALPRVQDHFDISGGAVGWLSSFMFCGMMFGAIGWGNCSDVLGRRIAFNATLVLSAIFGLFVSLSPNFPALCCALLLLGTAVGGSIPTDGTLFVENLPRRKHYLLTFLSIFFSFGAVVAAIVAVAVVPSHSCPGRGSGSESRPPCNVATQNAGWRYMFLVLTLLTALMFICRIFFFHLYESPRYLVHAGKHREAFLVLKQIVKANGDTFEVGIEDVWDKLVDQNRMTSAGNAARDRRDLSIDTHGCAPAESLLPTTLTTPRVVSRVWARPKSMPEWIWRPFMSWYDLSITSLSPVWRRTTILMWGAWMSTSAGYTLFNLFFPKLVELRLGKHAGSGNSLQSALWDVVIYTLGGTPGSLVGAWMVESRLGKRKSLALSNGLTGILCLLFTVVPSDFGVLVTSMGISFSTTVMYSVLYGMTPQMFVTKVRGTACGNASALNRVASIIAPPIGGFLLDWNVAFPTYASAVAFFIGAGCAFALPFESAADLEALEKSSGDTYTLLD